jgi:hypothetical protein
MHIPGGFRALSLSPGTWLLTRAEPPALEIIVQGVQLEAAETLSLANCAGLSIEWCESGVILRLSGAAQSSCIEARSAIVHESRPQLYQALPLAQFDAAAKRFWRRIFRIVRIPGGRYLLRVLARRTRSSA